MGLQSVMRSMEKWGLKLNQANIQALLLNSKCDQQCDALHTGDCNTKALVQLALTLKGVFKVYLLAHLVPLLLFKFKDLRKNPRKELWKLFIGVMNSLIFAGFSLALIKRIICLLVNHTSNNYTTIRYPAALAGLCLILESRTRQIEITLYCVSKGLETAYAIFKRRKYPVKIPFGNLWINGGSLAIITFAFLNEPTLFTEGYRKFLSLILNDV